jgi:hypothetical protein
MSNPADWKTYEELAYGIDTNRLPATDALAGADLPIRLNDGSTLHLRFEDGERLSWSETDGATRRTGVDAYDAVAVDNSTYFVDFWPRQAERDAYTVVVDTSTGRALTVLSTVAPEPVEGRPRVGQLFRIGAVGDAPPSGFEPRETRDLIGKRILNDYSPNHLYEHIYVNSNRYCWQCLAGVQKGHGDCDLASYYKFDEGRYLFTFREFRIPVASVFFFNMDTMRSTGKFLGIEGDGHINNSYAGAHISVLSTTTYPDGVSPV